MKKPTKQGRNASKQTAIDPKQKSRELAIAREKRDTERANDARIAEYYRDNNDPKQVKLLAEVSQYLRDNGSRHRVMPNLTLQANVAHLKAMESDTRAQLAILKLATTAITGSKLYAKLSQKPRKRK